jgi:hypothetical protein
LPNTLNYHHHPASFTSTTITVKQGRNGDVACFLKLLTPYIANIAQHPQLPPPPCILHLHHYHSEARQEWRCCMLLKLKLQLLKKPFLHFRNRAKSVPK